MVWYCQGSAEDLVRKRYPDRPSPKSHNQPRSSGISPSSMVTHDQVQVWP